MGKAKMPRKKKDPFADLPDEFKDKIAQGSREEIEKETTKVAMDQEFYLEQKKNDEDLQRAIAAKSVAEAQYTEAAKANKLKMKFIRRVMKDRGMA